MTDIAFNGWYFNSCEIVYKYVLLVIFVLEHYFVNTLK